MALARIAGLVSLLLITTCSAQRLNRVQDVEVRLYGGLTTDHFTIYKLPNSIDLFRSTAYNKNIPTVIFIHGFIMGPTTDIYLEMIRGLQSTVTGTKNIVAIDWTNMSDMDYFSSSVPNVKKVATAIAAQLKKAILNLLITAPKIELVGHSTGGHMIGFIGRNLQTSGYKLQKIISLDPAGPGYYPFNISGDTIKKSDATNVFVLHTNAFGLGSGAPCGTHDFWPNGGALQRGCVGQLPGCSHNRGITYFVESLMNPTAFAATKYNNYLEYLANFMTTSNPYIMFAIPILPITAPEGSYFFTTNYVAPYGRGLTGRYFSL